MVRTYIIAPRPLQPQRPLLRKLVKTLESLFESCGAVQVGPNGKNPPKIRFKHFRKLTDYTVWEMMNINICTANDQKRKLCESAETLLKKSWSHITGTYFWRVLAIWNLCVLCGASLDLTKSFERHVKGFRSSNHRLQIGSVYQIFKNVAKIKVKVISDKFNKIHTYISLRPC